MEYKSLDEVQEYVKSFLKSTFEKHPTGGYLSNESVMLLVEASVEAGYKFGNKWKDQDIRDAFDKGYECGWDMNDQRGKQAEFDNSNDYLNSVNETI